VDLFPVGHRLRVPSRLAKAPFTQKDGGLQQLRHAEMRLAAQNLRRRDFT
jgi:hypothetical protein